MSKPSFLLSVFISAFAMKCERLPTENQGRAFTLKRPGELMAVEQLLFPVVSEQRETAVDHLEAARLKGTVHPNFHIY